MLRLVALAVILLALASSTSVVEAKRAPHGKYTQQAKRDYANGLNALRAIPFTSPQQVLTSLGATPDSFVVTWLTFNTTTSPSIEWGITSGSYVNQAAASSRVFVDPNTGHTLRYMYTAHLTGLAPAQTVFYRVGSSNSMSDELKFTAPHRGAEILNVIMYGDLGVVNSQSVQYVTKEVSTGAVDMVIQIGDYAYDLHTDQGTVGDVFMNQIQPIASRVPYVGCAGNHEGKFNITTFNERFSAYRELGAASGSGADNNWWFSYDVVSGMANVHFVAINTEMYYVYVDEFVPPDYTSQRAAQYKWLDQDLARARAAGDWIIVYGHRPLYCSNTDSLGDCTTDTQLLREGYPNETNSMDAMFAKHHVDMYFTAHEHSYERTYPVQLGNIDNKQQNHTYINPLYPVHIVTGSAGCSEGLEAFDHVFYGPYSVVRSPTYGYGHLQIHNKTHLHWDQLLDEGNQGKDELWIIRGAKTTSETVLPSVRVEAS